MERSGDHIRLFTGEKAHHKSWRDKRSLLATTSSAEEPQKSELPAQSVAAKDGVLRRPETMYWRKFVFH
ncbi:hypothetical protein OESDEN_22516 [Oesophagostomum dentatum]|uniref:Uncharacterized protein n=1 Tax=Oesophagostomum dentatum TaxID=61180 RepID=A0A0B1RYT7_OESDE|nr:hypothetical protein OESDEN_22516 [Oesophagostomum dentatum]